MSTNHTPGPWLIADDGRFVYALDEDGFNRFSAHVQDAYTPDDELRANARLIAAAPDLLRVAELVVSWLDEEPGAHKLCDAARAAIAAATGEQT